MGEEELAAGPAAAAQDGPSMAGSDCAEYGDPAVAVGWGHALVAVAVCMAKRGTAWGGGPALAGIRAVIGTIPQELEEAADATAASPAPARCGRPRRGM
mmetsp:Transcript_94733/g.295106  ORF Transcript_94733/g.295106 Transcript_94733/m.295106 type:complete len:99 (-) Transcript_94733:444-740(-)